MADHRGAPGEAYVMEKAVPVGMRGGGGGIKRAFSGMWAGREGGKRFDMLRDEEGKEWETFEVELGLKGRAGMGVWDGFGEGTTESRTSFLGGALGGFVGIGSKEEEGGDFAGRAGAGDPMLASIQEWDEREEGGTSESHEEERTTESGGARSVGTQLSTSTGPTTPSSESHRLQSTSSRPFSPPSSLYGSSFSHQLALVPRPSQSSSSLSHAEKLSRSSTWWSRLAKPLPAETPTATANERIRDPTPAPALAAIVESPDPFADASSPTTYGVPDEQGRFDKATMGLRHERSISSNRSAGTATSSVLEERMRGMDVVERIRGGSGSTASATLTMGSEEGHQFGRMPREATTDEQDPFRDPQTTPKLGSTRRVQGPRAMEESGVQAMIRKIEKRNSGREGSGEEVGEEVIVGRKSTLDGGKSKVRVGHGLARKPVLYVANPDQED